MYVYIRQLENDIINVYQGINGINKGKQVPNLKIAGPKGHHLMTETDCLFALTYQFNMHMLP